MVPRRNTQPTSYDWADMRNRVIEAWSVDLGGQLGVGAWFDAELDSAGKKRESRGSKAVAWVLMEVEDGAKVGTVVCAELYGFPNPDPEPLCEKASEYVTELLAPIPGAERREMIHALLEDLHKTYHPPNENIC